MTTATETAADRIPETAEADPKPITRWNTAKTFATVGACSATMMTVLDRAYGFPMRDEEVASNPLAGGIVQHGYQCGQVWGAALAAGAEAHRRYGAGPRGEAAAVRASQAMVQAWTGRNTEIDCLELTEMQDTGMQTFAGVMKYLIKAGPISCARMAMHTAPLLKDAIDGALDEEPPAAISPCASCAARVARRMGASEQHQVMAAGLAGGIGLSGGACGALGAAVWLTQLADPDDTPWLTAEGTKIGVVIDRFLQASDHTFECSEIAGREFADDADHARYLESGGCAGIIDALVDAATRASAADDESRDAA